MERYMKLSDWAKQHKLTRQQAKRWYHLGYLKGMRAPYSRHILVEKDQKPPERKEVIGSPGKYAINAV